MVDLSGRRTHFDDEIGDDVERVPDEPWVVFAQPPACDFGSS